MAKLDKAPAYEAGDCRFESCSERQILPLGTCESASSAGVHLGLAAWSAGVSLGVDCAMMRQDRRFPVDATRLACLARNPVGEVAERLKALPC